MADNNIRFTLSTLYKGEGMDALNGAIKNNQKELAASVRGIGELTNAFAAVSPEAQVAVSQVKNFTNAFVQGGIKGGLIQVAMMGISKAVEYCAEKFKEAKENAKKYAEILRGDVAAAMTDAAKQYAEVQAALSQSNKEAQDLVKVLNGQAANEAANKIFEINKKKLEDLANAMTESERSVIEAVAAREIAAVKAAEADQKAANANDALAAAVGNATQLRAAASERLAAAEAAVENANARLASYNNGRAQIAQKITDAENDYAAGTILLAEHDRRIAAARVELAKYEEANKESVAYQTQINNELAAAKKAVADADIAFAEAQKAQQQAALERDTKRVEAETAALEVDAKVAAAKEKQADELESLIQFIDESAEQMKETSSTYEELVASAKGLKDAQDGAADALENGGGDDAKKSGLKGYGDDAPIQVKVSNPNEIGSSFSSSVDVPGIRSDIQKPRNLDDATWQRFKDGTANVADQQRVKRFQEAEARYGLQRISSDVTKFISLADKPDTWLSSRDRQFMDDFKTKVAPQLPAEMMKKMFQNNAQNVLTTSRMKQILGNDAVIKKWCEKFCLK